MRTLSIFLSMLAVALGAGGQDLQFSDPAKVVSLLEGRLPAPRFVPGEILVKPAPGAAAFAAGEAPGDGEGLLLLRIGGDGLTVMAAEDWTDKTLETVERLAAMPMVEYAQPNYLLQIQREPNDRYFPNQWHFFAQGTAAGQSMGGIGLPQVWDDVLGGPDVVVAIVDTGIVTDHPDFRLPPRFLPGVDMIEDAFIAADGDGRDYDATDPGDGVLRGECGVDGQGWPVPTRDLPDSWHGTHVAGILGVGSTDNSIGIAGASWGVSVLPIRALGKCGGTTRDIVDAIRWAAGLPVQNLEDNPHKAHVINLSLGGRGRCSPALQEAIGEARAQGVTVVVAAGNEGLDASDFEPASCEGALVVAASDQRGYLAGRYSNFGPRVDLLAPGGDVLRDDDGDGLPDGILSYVRGGYDLYNGTSMAAPLVAGVAALLKELDPQLSPDEIEETLRQHARPRSEDQCPRACGAGLLDAGFLRKPALAEAASPSVAGGSGAER